MLPDVVHTSRAAPGHHDRQPRARRGGPALDPGAPRLAPQRAPLRRAAGQGQEGRPCEQYGEEQFMLWRRSFDTPPPPIEAGNEFDQAGDPRYAGLGEARPRPSASRTSSRGCCPTGRARSSADLRAGTGRLVAAHGNSLRALVKHLDGISDDDIAGLNIPTGMPLVYRLGRRLQPVKRGGRVPRPRGAPRPRRRRRQPGPLTQGVADAADPRRPSRPRRLNRRTPARSRAGRETPDPPSCGSAAYDALPPLRWRGPPPPRRRRRRPRRRCGCGARSTCG